MNGLVIYRAPFALLAILAFATSCCLGAWRTVGGQSVDVSSIVSAQTNAILDRIDEGLIGLTRMKTSRSDLNVRERLVRYPSIDTPNQITIELVLFDAIEEADQHFAGTCGTIVGQAMNADIHGSDSDRYCISPVVEECYDGCCIPSGVYFSKVAIQKGLVTIEFSEVSARSDGKGKQSAIDELGAQFLSQ